MKPRGFSLIEVLISVGLMAIIGMLLLTSLSSSLDTKEAVEGTSNRYHLVRLAMSRMVDEVSMAYLSGHRSQLELKAETGFKGERDHLDFTAFGYVARHEDAKQSDQRELGYFLGDDQKTRTRALIRREQAGLDEDFEEGGRELTLLTDVTDVELSYYDQTTDEWKDTWDAEDAASSGRLPARVRIKLTVNMDGGESQTFMTQSKLVLFEKPINFQN